MASSATDASPDVPKNAKSFVPLENNPEVMTGLMHKLGLSKSLEFHDVYSIDEPELLAFVPRPVHALLLVFPVSKTYEKFRTEEDAPKSDYAGKGASEPVVWYKQTIRNACGLIGLLHAVSNGGARKQVEPKSDLATLLDSVEPLGPVDRANFLYTSDTLEAAHASAASTGATSAPGADDDVDLHFVCFVKDKDGRELWEMDGRRKGPLNRGALEADDDVLSEAALDKGVRSFLKREQQAGGGELRFSLLALAPAMA